MGSRQEYIPIFKRFISIVKKGYEALDQNSQTDVKNFVQSCQNTEGAFTNRAVSPDIYYSIFGTWLAVALGMDETLKKHRQFILQTEWKNKNQVEESAFLLIKLSLPEVDFIKPSIKNMLFKMFLKSSSLSFFYRLFLFTLVFDGFYRKEMFYPAARAILSFISPPADSPCSIHAAYTVIKNETGMKIKQEQANLLSFFEEGSGFRSFKDTEGVDLLSTAVALFALKTIGADLRMIAPDCLEMIQENYAGGAFLAGNGDETRDLEYTFYGLMALGILVS